MEGAHREQEDASVDLPEGFLADEHLLPGFAIPLVFVANARVLTRD